MSGPGDSGRAALSGIAVGLGLAAVTGALVAAVSPRAIPHVPEMVVSLLLLVGAFAGVGVSGAAYVEESRAMGRRVAVWLALGTGFGIGAAVLLLALAASLFAFLPVTVLRVVLLVGVTIPAVIAAGAMLINCLQEQPQAEAETAESSARLAESATELEDAAGLAPAEVAVDLRRVVERHRRAIEPMAHRATAEDDELTAAMREAARLVSSPDAGGSRSADSLGPVREALDRVALLQERRIRGQVSRG